MLDFSASNNRMSPGTSGYRGIDAPTGLLMGAKHAYTDYLLSFIRLFYSIYIQLRQQQPPRTSSQKELVSWSSSYDPRERFSPI